MSYEPDVTDAVIAFIGFSIVLGMFLAAIMGKLQ